MSHKVHPKVYRIREMKDWSSRWFDLKNIPKNLQLDCKIRDYIFKKLAEAGVQEINIERFTGKLKVIIHTARPGLIIGRQGKGIEDVKKEIQNKILKDKTEIIFEIKEIKNPWMNATFVAQWMAQQIERRTPFRKALKQALSKIKFHKEIKGAKIELNGRLNGVTIARKEWVAYGRLPRQTIRAIIDYGFWEARCTYGTIGIKVWLYKGEKFE
ncbi:MAG TPA: 30S ribosomal protein S3 [Candidatus Pacearchaeota archaeon]|nr:30S ribosomal protein S3 [Candidatus Pacearchaeota archaeon]